MFENSLQKQLILTRPLFQDNPHGNKHLFSRDEDGPFEKVLFQRKRFSPARISTESQFSWGAYAHVYFSLYSQKGL